MVPDNTVHLSHNLPQCGTWVSLTFDIDIDTYILPFVYLLLSDLLYRLTVDWETPGSLTPTLIVRQRTNNQARAAPPLARCKGDLWKSMEPIQTARIS